MERREYDDATKAAVMAALLTGQSISSVAKEYSLPKGTVHGWRKQAQNMLAGAEVAEETTQKRDAIGGLLIDYLHASLKTLRVQVEHFGDKDWLTRQSADSLAVLHGVTVDKTIRLLEALTSDKDEAA